MNCVNRGRRGESAIKNGAARAALAPAPAKKENEYG
jgi:hypothetical protein